jgi:hypothetical protein
MPRRDPHRIDVQPRCGTGMNRAATSYLEGGRRRRKRLLRGSTWLLLVLALAAVLATAVFLAQASASESGVDCRHGEISAIGPVDAQGRGDTVPDFSCLEP